MRILCTVAMLLLLFPLIVSKEIQGRSPDVPELRVSVMVQTAQAVVEESKVGVGVFFQATKAFNIEGAPDVPLNKLVRLMDFGDFRPGLTIKETTAKFGPPVRIEADDYRTSAVYDLPTARIEVEEKETSSGCTTAHRRTVYAYPKPSVYGCLKLNDLVDPSLNIPVGTSGMVEVAVSQAGYDQRVWILVKDGCVRAMNWWKMPTQQ